MRALGDRGDAVAVDVLHREDVHAGRANLLLLLLVEVADADEHGVLRAAPTATMPIDASSAGSWPSSAASGMPCTLPLRRRLRRVHVAVRVHPDQAERLRRRARGPSRRSPPPIRRRGCDRRRARAAARPRRATAARRRTASGRPRAISRMYFLRSSAGALRLRNRRRQVALVDDRAAERARSDRRGRRCGTPTAPCPRRGGRRRGRAARR